MHGDYTDNAMFSQALKRICHSSPNWAELSDVQQETLDYYCLKISRILSGDFDFHDHWVDIGGYSKLTSDRIKRD